MSVHPSIQTAADQFGVGELWVKRALEGLSEEDVRRKAGDDSNPMIWILGHLVYCRVSVANLAGGDRKHRWSELFRRGSEKRDPSEYPSLEDMLAEWDRNTEEMQSAFEAATEEHLSSKAPRDFPIRDKTNAGAISFLAMHEAQHAGQMLYLRKLLGK